MAERGSFLSQQVGEANRRACLELDRRIAALGEGGSSASLTGPMHIAVKNTSGFQIGKGYPVYATGSVGASGAVEVAASRADTAGTMPALGLLDETLAVNAEGSATVVGVIREVDTSSYSENDELYVAPSGGLTDVRPSGASELVQKIGRVVRAHAQTGEILVLGAGRTNDIPNGDLTLTAGGGGSNVVWTGPTGPMGLEISPSGTFESALYYRTTPLAWSFENASGDDILTIDIDGQKVGVGIDAPDAKFHVYGGTSDTNIRVTSSDAGAYIGFDDSTTTLDWWRQRVGVQGNSLVLQTNGNTRMTIDSSGNVGINDTTPSYTLDVDGTFHVTGQTTADGDIYFQNNALVASNAGSSNIDHIWHDETNNAWNFVSDTTYKAAGNSKIVAGDGDFSGDLTVRGGELHMRGTDTNFPNAINFHTSGTDGSYWHMSAPRENQAHDWRLYWYNGSSFTQTIAVTPQAGLEVPGTITSTGEIRANGNISLRSGNAVRDSIYRVGGVYFTWDSDSYGTNTHHSIRSTYGDGWTDCITINSFNHIRLNIDSNNNNTGSVFEVGRDTTGTGNVLLTLTDGGALTVSAHIRCNEVWGDNGSATDPSFTFNSDQDTGVYRYGSNSLGFTTGGGYRARISSDGIHLASGDWFRSYGSTGWYNGTHGGGMYMIDSTWVRTYNNKRIYTGSGQIRSDAGNAFNAPNMTSTWSYNTVRWNSSNGDLMRYASLTEMKTDIVEINGVLGYLNERSFLYDLTPRIFHEADDRVDHEGNPVYTTRGEYGHGFLAEEVLEVAPELAYFDQDGELTSYGNDALIPDIVAELQRLMPMVEELYGAAHPDWVAPTPRPVDRAADERQRYDEAAAAQAAVGFVDIDDPLDGQRHLDEEE
jgi:hypothetical protein